MITISRSMAENLRPEISYVQTEHSAPAHRVVPAGRGPYPAFPRDGNRSERRQPPPEIRVLAMELDRTVESADARQRVASDGEVASIENRARIHQVVHHHVRRRRDHIVIRTNQGPADPVPIVETVRARDRDESRLA